MNLYETIIPSTSKGTFGLSFCLCLLVCMSIIFVITPLTDLSRDFRHGHDGYIELAENIAHGNGYVFEKGGPPVFHRPPLYPLLLVPITYLPTSLQWPALVLMQSILVGFIAVLIFEIAKSLFSLSIARTAVIVFLANPWVYWNAKNPMSVVLQGLLYVLLMVLAGSEFLIAIGHCSELNNKTHTWLRRIGTGAAAAALVLTHGTMLAAGLVSLLILFLAGTLLRKTETVKTAVLALLVMAGLIAPWTYRNWVVFHRFIPIAGGSGLAYFNGNVHWKNIIPNPQRRGETYIDASLRVAGINGTEAAVTRWKGLQDIRLEDRVNEKMREDMRVHPMALAKKIMFNAVEYYFPMLTWPYLAIRSFSAENLAITIFNLVLWILVLTGLWGWKKDDLHFGSCLMLAAIVLYAVWFLPFATFIGHSLYTFGTMPFLSILAAKGIDFVKSRFY